MIDVNAIIEAYHKEVEKASLVDLMAIPTDLMAFHCAALEQLYSLYPADVREDWVNMLSAEMKERCDSRGGAIGRLASQGFSKNLLRVSAPKDEEEEKPS